MRRWVVAAFVLLLAASVRFADTLALLASKGQSAVTGRDVILLVIILVLFVLLLQSRQSRVLLGRYQLIYGQEWSTGKILGTAIHKYEGNTLFRLALPAREPEGVDQKSVTPNSVCSSGNQSWTFRGQTIHGKRSKHKHVASDVTQTVVPGYAARTLPIAHNMPVSPKCAVHWFKALGNVAELGYLENGNWGQYGNWQSQLREAHFNVMGLEGEWKVYDSERRVCFVPILSRNEVENWEGNAYSAFVVGCDLLAYTEIGMQKGTNIRAADPAEVQTGFDTLTKVILSLAAVYCNPDAVANEKELGRSETENPSLYQCVATWNWLSQQQEVRTPRFARGAGEGFPRIEFCKTTFSWNHRVTRSINGLHPAPHPYLLLLRAANWWAFNHWKDGGVCRLLLPACQELDSGFGGSGDSGEEAAQQRSLLSEALSKNLVLKEGLVSLAEYSALLRHKMR